MSRSLAVCAATAVGALAGASHGAITTYVLIDHADGSANPPPYGLRLDNAFSGLGGAGGTTSFSFDAAFNDNARTDVTMDIDDVAMTITISGEVYGGEDSGGAYGFGEGWYDLSFTYSANVMQMGTGWVVNPGAPASNSGSLTSQGNADVPMGTVIDFYDMVTGNAFIFKHDGHRISGDNSTPVGRGWVSLNSDGSNSAGTQDWLFVATPTPGTGALLALGLLATRRRR